MERERRRRWKRILQVFPSGHMVKNHMTVIRVDGELPKNVDSCYGRYAFEGLTFTSALFGT